VERGRVAAGPPVTIGACPGLRVLETRGGSFRAIASSGRIRTTPSKSETASNVRTNVLVG
jgi:hypothetical protein